MNTKDVTAMENYWHAYYRNIIEQINYDHKKELVARDKEIKRLKKFWKPFRSRKEKQ